MRLKGHALASVKTAGKWLSNPWTVVCECGWTRRTCVTKKGAVDAHYWHKVRVKAGKGG